MTLIAAIGLICIAVYCLGYAFYNNAKHNDPFPMLKDADYKWPWYSGNIYILVEKFESGRNLYRIYVQFSGPLPKYERYLLTPKTDWITYRKYDKNTNTSVIGLWIYSSNIVSEVFKVAETLAGNVYYIKQLDGVYLTPGDMERVYKYQREYNL